MTDLAERSTRNRFGTSEVLFTKGKNRKIIVEARPRCAIIKFSGLHAEYEVPWSAIASLAVKADVAAKRAAKKAKVAA